MTALTPRQEQIADLLYLRLFPLRRLYVQRLDRLMASEPVTLEDGTSCWLEEYEYAEEANRLLRLQHLISRLSSRLPPLCPELQGDDQPADLQL